MRRLLPLALALLSACGEDPSESAEQRERPSLPDGPIRARAPELTDLARSFQLDPTKTDAIKLTFQWPYRSSYSVTQSSWKEEAEEAPKYTSGHYSMQLAWEKESWLLSGGEAKITGLNDHPLAPVPGDVQSLLDLVVPDQRIDPAGSWLGLRDYDAYMEGLSPVFHDSAEVREKTLRALQTPSWREVMEAEAAKPWRAWVETWTGIEAEPGEEWVVEEDVEVSDGSFMPYRITTRFLGWVVAPEGHVLLERVIEFGIDAETMGEITDGMIDAIETEIPEDVDFSFPRVESLIRMLVVTDPLSLVPHHATYEETNCSYEPGKEPEIKLEAFEWTFALAK